LGDDLVPDETTILRFRHLLEKHELTGAIFDAIAAVVKLIQPVTAGGLE
jgi:IS5 family transposase